MSGTTRHAGTGSGSGSGSGTGSGSAGRVAVEAGAGPSARTRLVDAVLLLGTGVLSLSALASAYGTWRWLPAAAAGLLLGLGLAGLSARLRLGPWPTVLVGVPLFVVGGAAVAVPDAASAGFLPGPAALRAVVTGSVDAWREALTGITPLGSAGAVLLVPFAIGLLGTLVAALVLWRSRRPSLAVLPVAGLFVAAAAFGDSDAGGTLLRGLLLGGVVLCWLRWRSLRGLRVQWTRRIALTAAALVVAGAAGTGMAVLTAPAAPREVLRSHITPPFDPLAYRSPLSAFRGYLKAPLKDATLFTVSGLPAGSRVRLATMDTFDGVVWNVAGGLGDRAASGSFERLPKPGATDDETTYQVRIGDYRGVWVPSAGEETSVTVAGVPADDADEVARGVLANRSTGTMAQVGGVRAGTTYDVTTTLPPAVDEEQLLAATAAPGPRPAAPRDVPQKLATTTGEWAGAVGSGAAGAVARELEARFGQGYYSDGLPGTNAYPSASGHGSKRLADLFDADELVGNAEQYASAMGVALQRLGLPARVVVGFEVPDGSGAVTGDDVSAWVQVDLAGLGWVDFLPTPDKDRELNKLEDNPDPQPQPQVMQPPDVPQEPSDDEDVAQSGGVRGQRETDEPRLPIPAEYLWVAGAAGGLLLPVALILGLKALRRRRRRRAADPVDRFSGGWREVADGASDLGTRLPAGNTRRENAATLRATFDVEQIGTLATLADDRVFGPSAPSEDDVAAYWRDVRTAQRGMRRAAPWRRRVLAPLSLASFGRPRRPRLGRRRRG